MERLFSDRFEAGQLLAKYLKNYANCSDVLVLGLSHGGVPVAFEVSKALRLPLDIFLMRQIYAHDYPELAIGAIALGGVIVRNESIIKNLNISELTIKTKIIEEEKELMRHNIFYRGKQAALNVQGCKVIVVDDGLTAGSSMEVAVRALKQMQPAHITVAVPVATCEAYDALKTSVDEIISLKVPQAFFGINQWYQDFSPMTDEEVRMLLARASHFANRPASAA